MAKCYQLTPMPFKGIKPAINTRIFNTEDWHSAARNSSTVPPHYWQLMRRIELQRQQLQLVEVCGTSAFLVRRQSQVRNRWRSAVATHESDSTENFSIMSAFWLHTRCAVELFCGSDKSFILQPWLFSTAIFMPWPPSKRCRRHSVFGSVRLWVSESVSKSVCPEDIVNTISLKPTTGISPNFGRRYIWVGRCADYILRSKGQRSRSQQVMTQRTA